MTGAGQANWAAQSGFDVRLSWGPAGIDALRGDVWAIVLVDVLRFTTAVDVATTVGASVRPVPWPYRPSSVAVSLDDVPLDVADGSGPRGLSLSPASLRGLGSQDRIVLPSANGSHCSTLAAGSGAVVLGACLRNAVAVGAWIRARAGTEPVGVVPCGETWPDGRLRPAVEDLLGAGAVVAALAGEGSCSPEAAAARAAFADAGGDLEAVLCESESGRELRAKGRADDVVWAAERDVSASVPVLGDDGFYRDAGAAR